MGKLSIIAPLAMAGITASRGQVPENLLTRDPKEAWADTAAGSPVQLTVDLGTAQTIDTVFLGYVTPPRADATWSIDSGLAGPGESAIVTGATLRVPDVAGSMPATSHALWRGVARSARYVRLTLNQPSPGDPLTAGVIVIGQAFVASYGQEWGSGRQPIDTGTSTDLASGGFGVVEGVRKLVYSWTFGDLSAVETNQLELIALALGETLPGLVIEDDAVTPGLRARIHYGLFKKWSAFERRNRAQTRWDIGIRQWI